ncbi:MAG: GNAT family N-acetyltransferase [Pseudomonadota bacterium]
MRKLDFDIRLFDPADLPHLHRVRKAAFAPVYRSFRSLLSGHLAEVIFANAEDEQGSHLDHVCNTASDHHIFVAAHQGQIIGFCGASLNDQHTIGTIGLNAVHPEFASQGVGTALYEHVIAWIKDQGAIAVQVSTGDDPSHAPARKAYEKAGFRKSIPARSYYLSL